MLNGTWGPVLLLLKWNKSPTQPPHSHDFPNLQHRVKPSLTLPGALPVKWVWNINVVLFRLCSVCVLPCKLGSALALRSFCWYPVSINADLNKHRGPNYLVLLTWHCICYGTLETGRLYPAQQKHPQLYHTASGSLELLHCCLTAVSPDHYLVATYFNSRLYVLYALDYSMTWQLGFLS